MMGPPFKGEDENSHQMGDRETGWMAITSQSRSLGKQAGIARGKRSNERISDPGRAPLGVASCLVQVCKAWRLRLPGAAERRPRLVAERGAGPGRTQPHPHPKRTARQESNLNRKIPAAPTSASGSSAGDSTCGQAWEAAAQVAVQGSAPTL